MLVTYVQERLGALADALGSEVVSMSVGLIRTIKGLIEVDSHGVIWLSTSHDGLWPEELGMLEDNVKDLRAKYLAA